MGLQSVLIQLNSRLSSGFICITVDACRDNSKNATFSGSGCRGDTVTLTATRSTKIKKCVQGAVRESSWGF